MARTMITRINSLQKAYRNNDMLGFACPNFDLAPKAHLEGLEGGIHSQALFLVGLDPGV